MTTEQKTALINSVLNQLAQLGYKRLANKLGRTNRIGEKLLSASRLSEGGNEYHITVEIFWDSKAGGDIRMSGDLCTPRVVATSKNHRIIMPDVSNSIIVYGN